MSTLSIHAEHLSKKYRLGSNVGAGRLTEAIGGVLRRTSKPDDEMSTHVALEDVSFDVEVGEVVGIIGHNGAGKSTLLKIISRVTAPDAGFIDVRGRVGSLLEVGTGFHPELTGRENVFLNGAILGMRRNQIVTKLDEILAFAGVEQFADTPVKRYSSGMYTRLAFAVAAHLEPEILVVDEVLSVGDAAFQAKSLGKMDSLAKSGRTVLFVSHNTGSIARLCDRCIWIERGRIRASGRTQDTITAYLEASSPDAAAATFDERPEAPAQFHSLAVSNDSGQEGSYLNSGAQIYFDIAIDVRRPLPGLHFNVFVLEADGRVAINSDIGDEHGELVRTLPPGRHRFRVTLPPRLLAPGRYFINAGMSTAYGEIIDGQVRALAFTLMDTMSTYAKDQPGLIGLPLPWSREP